MNRDSHVYWWSDLALCKGKTGLFFAPSDIEDPRKEQGARERKEIAKALCEVCPVLRQCQDWAMENAMALGPNDYGIAGGLEETERKSWARKIKRSGDHYRRTA